MGPAAHLLDRLRTLRRELHRAPELAYCESRTAARVAAWLRELPGVEVSVGLAGTGVLGSLQGAAGPGPAVTLRAELDAVAGTERSGVPWASQATECMHGCGHDGHIVMLLGAASVLASAPDFRGTLRFLFQPAEENEGGARRLLAEGLLQRHPCDPVYGLHNWPGLPAGRFAVRAGPIMASYDVFRIRVSGRGVHAAKPHLGVDPIVAAAQVVSGLQTITSRRVDPLDSVVVSVTELRAGNTWNVIPDEATLRGTTRALRPEVRSELEGHIARVTNGVCAAHGCAAEVHYERRYPPTVNHAGAAEHAARAASAVAGPEGVLSERPPSMGAEDFAFYLEQRPGCYVWLGAGEGSAPLHSPRYDFNDDLIEIGCRYWLALVRELLGAPAGQRGGSSSP